MITAVCAALGAAAPYTSIAPRSFSSADEECDMVVNGAICLFNGRKVLLPDAVPKDMVAHWTFDEMKVVDSSGSRNHARNPIPAGMCMCVELICNTLCEPGEKAGGCTSLKIARSSSSTLTRPPRCPLFSLTNLTDDVVSLIYRIYRRPRCWRTRRERGYQRLRLRRDSTLQLFCVAALQRYILALLAARAANTGRGAVVPAAAQRAARGGREPDAFAAHALAQAQVRLRYGQWA